MELVSQQLFVPSFPYGCCSSLDYSCDCMCMKCFLPPSLPSLSLSSHLLPPPPVPSPSLSLPPSPPPPPLALLSLWRVRREREEMEKRGNEEWCLIVGERQVRKRREVKGVYLFILFNFSIRFLFSICIYLNMV